MTANLDVIVIGTGEAARPVAYACREAGRSVAVIDSLPFGGTCELRGCDPKKVLVGVSELIDWSHRMQGKGASAPAMSVNWSDLIRFKRTFTDPVPRENEQGFEEAGISAFHGRAHFVDRASVEVDGEQLVGLSVVIATGARPTTLGIPGEELLTTSTQFLELDQLPGRVVFVGGGYIAFEFAHIAARAGAQVHVLHRGDRPLEQFDPDLGRDASPGHPRARGRDPTANGSHSCRTQGGRSVDSHADGRAGARGRGRPGGACRWTRT